jgi:hypothetical protein
MSSMAQRAGTPLGIMQAVRLRWVPTPQRGRVLLRGHTCAMMLMRESLLACLISLEMAFAKVAPRGMDSTDLHRCVLQPHYQPVLVLTSSPTFAWHAVFEGLQMQCCTTWLP